jgi:Cu-processing system ATP-binding protein
MTALEQREAAHLKSPRALVLPRAIVEVSDVTKRFGRLTVLNHVSFRARAGRVTAILGPNAAGKSTIIKALLGLVRADAGRMAVDGAIVDGTPGYRQRVGYMPQNPRFPENLTGNEVVAMLRDVRPGCTADEELFQELGLTPEMKKPVRTLSGGTRQKLNAAIAFLFQPSLLILDEPTAGLDPVASGILKAKILRARDAGASVILTSHVLAELEELVDDIVFLLEGRVAFAGSIDQLRQATGEERLERAIAGLMTRETP